MIAFLFNIFTVNLGKGNLILYLEIWVLTLYCFCVMLVFRYVSVSALDSAPRKAPDVPRGMLSET